MPRLLQYDSDRVPKLFKVRRQQYVFGKDLDRSLWPPVEQIQELVTDEYYNERYSEAELRCMAFELYDSKALRGEGELQARPLSPRPGSISVAMDFAVPVALEIFLRESNIVTEF